MKKKKILITGGLGLLGKALAQTAPMNYDIYLTFFNDKPSDLQGNHKYINLDIVDKSKVRKILNEERFDVVIHTASIGNVDFCEKNKEIAKKTNVDGTTNLLTALDNSNTHFIFLSSNAVFDGLNAPYDENSVPNPTNFYGKTKVIGEEKVKSLSQNSTIVRPVLMFGWNFPQQRKNPVTWILEELKRGNKLKLVDDIFNNPILNIEAAKAIWEIVDKNITGIVHIAGAERLSRYDLGMKVANSFNLNSKLISKVSSDFFPKIVPRMPDTTYNTDKMKMVLKITPKSISESLELMKESIPPWIKR